MFMALIAQRELLKNLSNTKMFDWLLLIATGMLVPLGFAPFHLPGAAILGVSLFYNQIQPNKAGKAWFQGFAFGLGFFGLGISWVSISVHDYGHLSLPLAYLITAVFVIYLALFPAFCAYLFRVFCFPSIPPLIKALLFTSLWCLSEYARAICFTGFPWLMLGFGQIDTPLRYLLPITGIYGASFIAVLAACCLSQAVKQRQSLAWLLGFVILLIAPQSLRGIEWSEAEKTPLTVGVIQSNLSMRDKWDDGLFWEITEYYHHTIQQLIGKKN